MRLLALIVQLNVVYANLHELHTVVHVKRRRFNDPRIKYHFSLRDRTLMTSKNDPNSTNLNFFAVIATRLGEWRLLSTLSF